jgi:hypothetical protein
MVCTTGVKYVCKGDSQAARDVKGRLYILYRLYILFYFF